MEKKKNKAEDLQGKDDAIIGSVRFGENGVYPLDEKTIKRSGSVSYSIKALKDHLTVLLNANIISIEEFNMIEDVRKNAGGEWLKRQMGL